MTLSPTGNGDLGSSSGPFSGPPPPRSPSQQPRHLAPAQPPKNESPTSRSLLLLLDCSSLPGHLFVSQTYQKSPGVPPSWGRGCRSNLRQHMRPHEPVQQRGERLQSGPNVSSGSLAGGSCSPWLLRNPGTTARLTRDIQFPCTTYAGLAPSNRN